MLASKFVLIIFLAETLFSLTIATTATTRSNPLVSTWNGVVRGREARTISKNRQFFAFQGIPYAEPPLGNRRFAPSVPKSPWEGVIDATKDRSVCIQGGEVVVGSEDCLFINVYTPKLPDYITPLLPTMVYIHGGAFEAGGSSYAILGPDHLLEKDVVVVTFNYRLGILGFLSTGDLVVPGNNGLKDQVLALQWVQENIRRFGGNPNKITVFGQSAGGASITYLLQSSVSEGLFHHAIIQSGVSLAHWALSRHSPKVAAQTATLANLDNSTSQSIIEGLKTLNATYLQQTASKAATDHYLTDGNVKNLVFAFGPCAEPEHTEALFTKKSHEVLEKGDFYKVPIIIGYNSLEGTMLDIGAFSLILLLMDLNPGRLTTPSLNINNSTVQSIVGRTIKTEYFGTVPIFQSHYQVIQYVSDDVFTRPTREFVNLVRKQGVSAFFYKFSYEGNLAGLGTNRTYPGVTHGEELFYIFRSQFEEDAFDEDLLTRERILSLWTNFAKTGHPTSDNKEEALLDINWQHSDEHYTHIDIGVDIVLGQHPDVEKMTFWDNIFREYGTPPYDTY